MPTHRVITVPQLYNNIMQSMFLVLDVAAQMLSIVNISRDVAITKSNWPSLSVPPGYNDALALFTLNFVDKQ